MPKVLWSLFLLVGCSGVEPCYPSNGRLEMSNVPEHVTGISALGFGIDDPGGELDNKKLDLIVQGVVDCVLDAGLPLTPKEQRAAWCTGIMTPEIRSCLVVKTAPEWYVSPCSGSQVFSCAAPDASCTSKGLVVTSDCPCVCRATVQHDSTIVTAPNMVLLPWRLTELLTGCDQIQEVPRLAKCGATP